MVCGQNEVFQDISLFDKKSKGKDMKMIYFHFEGCPPCKKMDEKVLSQENVKSYLKKSFDCYSVYGFDSLATYYRNMFGVKSNPCFLFVDKSNKVQHKIVGYYQTEHFLKECINANSAESLYNIELEYAKNLNDISFMRKYVIAKEKAGELQDDIIDKYLEMIPTDSLSSPMYCKDVLTFGYYRGRKSLQFESPLYNLVTRLYNENSEIFEKEDLRGRILFSINEAFYLPGLNEMEKRRLIDEMAKYENGNRIFLRELGADHFYAVFENRYPSFVYRYNLAKSRKDTMQATNILQDHFAKVYSEPEALNNLAWGIFIEDYKEDPILGLKIIERSLEIKKHYNYYDTYAALLHKSGRLNEAKVMAMEAIHLAQESNYDFEGAKKLLAKINMDLSN